MIGNKKFFGIITVLLIIILVMLSVIFNMLWTEKYGTKIDYVKYKNARYGYLVEVPDFLIAEREAENSDGRGFESKDGEFTIDVWGSKRPMVFEEFTTLDGYYSDRKDSLDYIPSYEEKTENYYVFSGVQVDVVIWEKYILKSDGTDNNLIIKYPKDKREKYDKVAEYIVKHFIPGEGIDSVAKN